jgi:hypothetical protein
MEEIIETTSCFPHFLKNASETPDFIGLIFEIGCCKVKFGDVFAKIGEPVR